MRLPRDISGTELIKMLEQQFGYIQSRQAGSHVRLSCTNPEHHITVPKHNALRIGTLSSILSDVANHHKLSRENVAERLFG